ncbi:MAG: valyl-tRNA synthetase [Parcubacteria group bacterium Gr01-1014_13]|nr:MAG: valyl-tRNA synthetase [Parcubacteria group bacterium Gr01-1014_13]
MKELSKAYEPKNYEDNIYKKWEESGLFNPDVCVKQRFTKKNAKPFSIVLPPPNVTGTLHMGHAAMLAIEDVMVRYHRMKGDRTLWVPGTDHAAIATQAKVEKLVMEKEGKTKYDLGRDEFLKRVESFAQESHDTIVNQSRKMGASLDWSREAYTLDEKRNLAVRTVFKKMYDDKLIYRGYRVINWSVKGQSTVSDDELVHVERPGKLYYFKYSKDFPITIATTRPETKLGDTAVAVNPKDARYKKYIGQEFVVDVGAAAPLKIKIIADENIELEFGTGALGVTPAHSSVDFEMYQKQKADGNDIGLIQVISEDGKMTAAAGKDYAGLTVLAAREKFVEYLRKNNLLEKEEDIVQNVGTSDRFGDVIEPLPKTQWFIDVNKPIKSRGKKTLKQLMQKAVGNKKGQIEIIPDRFNKTYFHWIDNLRDWCISRQIWYGHQIPVWYKGEEVFVGVEAPRGEGWQQDPDTLDTWFSSGLWTFSTLGYPDLKASDLKNYHPTSVMETGYDILFFWVARMILMTTYVLDDIPFKKVYLHGLVRDEKGQKMSKSLGNVIDPLDMINKYGTDATRLSLLVGNTPGNDMKLSEEKIAGFRNFTNKLWNISRFMLLNIENPKIDIKKPKAKTLADEWILEGLDKVIQETSKNIEEFNFSMVGEKLRDFTWSELADWYLEIAKVEGKKSEILNYILNTILKLWHPYMPFVTEAIWQEVYGADKTLMVEPWMGVKKANPTAKGFNDIINTITSIRSLRAEYKIEPAKKIGAHVNAGKKEKLLRNNQEIIKSLARLESLEFVKTGAEVSLDLAGAVDVAKEKPRLEKEIAELKKYTAGLENKLLNKEFVSNAPKEVVEKEKGKLNEAKSKLEKLEEQLNNLK